MTTRESIDLDEISAAQLKILAYQLKVPKNWAVVIALRYLRDRIDWEERDLVTAYVEKDRRGNPSGRVNAYKLTACEYAREMYAKEKQKVG